MAPRSEYENQPSWQRDMERALWDHWDPIGLNTPEDPGPDDEYNGYAPHILGLLLRGASDEEVATALLVIEVDRMGADPHPLADLIPVAERLRTSMAHALS